MSLPLAFVLHRAVTSQADKGETQEKDRPNKSVRQKTGKSTGTSRQNENQEAVLAYAITSFTSLQSQLADSEAGPGG